MASRTPSIDVEKLKTLCLACPGASSILGIKGSTVSTTDIFSLFRLALSSKVRGSVLSADRARHAQNCGYVLVAKCALSRQQVGILQWIGVLAPPQDTVRTSSGMWDEASQNMRVKILRGCEARCQHVAGVFVMSSGVSEARLVSVAF